VTSSSGGSSSSSGGGGGGGSSSSSGGGGGGSSSSSGGGGGSSSSSSSSGSGSSGSSSSSGGGQSVVVSQWHRQLLWTRSTWLCSRMSTHLVTCRRHLRADSSHVARDGGKAGDGVGRVVNVRGRVDRVDVKLAAHTNACR
jgi:hypothetical protein